MKEGGWSNDVGMGGGPTCCCARCCCREACLALRARRARRAAGSCGDEALASVRRGLRGEAKDVEWVGWCWEGSRVGRGWPRRASMGSAAAGLLPKASSSGRRKIYCREKRGGDRKGGKNETRGGAGWGEEGER